jgi:hypothetical protein
MNSTQALHRGLSDLLSQSVLLQNAIPLIMINGWLVITLTCVVS